MTAAALPRPRCSATEPSPGGRQRSVSSSARGGAGRPRPSRFRSVARYPVTGGSNVPMTPTRADEQDFLPTIVILRMPGFVDLTETTTAPFLAVFAVLFTPDPTSRTVVLGTGLPAAVSLMPTLACFPTGIDRCVTRITVQTAAVLTAFRLRVSFALVEGAAHGGRLGAG